MEPGNAKLPTWFPGIIETHMLSSLHQNSWGQIICTTPCFYHTMMMCFLFPLNFNSRIEESAVSIHFWMQRAAKPGWLPPGHRTNALGRLTVSMRTYNQGRMKQPFGQFQTWNETLDIYSMCIVSITCISSMYSIKEYHRYIDSL